MERTQRGQAAVEAALGTLVLVTVLVFGIHFAEVGYLSVKVTEAANFATFDATGRQQHKYGGSLDSAERGNAVSTAQTKAQNRYTDYNSDTGGGAGPTQVFTKAGALTVECTELNGPARFGTLNIGSGLAGVYNNNDQGGMECHAEGKMNIFHIGKFQDTGGGFFKQKHIATGQTSIKICSNGRAWSAGGNGSCDANVPIMLGDWGLSDTAGNEADECDLYSCVNTRYKAVVQTAFGNVAGPTGKGTALAMAVTGFGTPEGAYWMTFKGEESGFQQDLGGEHAGPGKYTVTPGGPYEAVNEYQIAHGARQACFLGFPCNWKYSSQP